MTTVIQVGSVDRADYGTDIKVTTSPAAERSADAPPQQPRPNPFAERTESSPELFPRVTRKLEARHATVPPRAVTPAESTIEEEEILSYTADLPTESLNGDRPPTQYVPTYERSRKSSAHSRPESRLSHAPSEYAPEVDRKSSVHSAVQHKMDGYAKPYEGGYTTTTDNETRPTSALSKSSRPDDAKSITAESFVHVGKTDYHPDESRLVVKRPSKTSRRTNSIYSTASEQSVREIPIKRDSIVSRHSQPPLPPAPKLPTITENGDHVQIDLRGAGDKMMNIVVISSQPVIVKTSDNGDKYKPVAISSKPVLALTSDGVQAGSLPTTTQQPLTDTYNSKKSFARGSIRSEMSIRSSYRANKMKYFLDDGEDIGEDGKLLYEAVYRLVDTIYDVVATRLGQPGQPLLQSHHVRIATRISDVKSILDRNRPHAVKMVNKINEGVRSTITGGLLSRTVAKAMHAILHDLTRLGVEAEYGLTSAAVCEEFAINAECAINDVVRAVEGIDI